MTDFLFRANAAAGRVAIWQKPAVGDRMAPFDDPTGNFDLIRFCSDFQYLTVTDEQPVTINHTLLAGVTGTGYSVSAGSGSTGSSQPIANGQIRVSSIEMMTHGLGYEPLFDVLYDGQVVSNTVIQNPSGQLRMISSYATTSKIYLKEIAISSTADLPAASRDYTVLIYRDPVADPAKPFLRIKPGVEICLGWGKVTDSQRAIRRTEAGDAELYVPLDRVLDIKNGAIRTISPISGTFDLGFYTGGFVSANAIPVTY